MKKILLSSIAIATLSFATDYKYEVSPMIGYIDTKEKVDIKNHKAFGLGAYRNMDEECMFDQLELALFHSNNADYENSNLETDINLLSLNAIKEYKINDTFNLYALAGVGYEQIKDSYFKNESDPFGNYGVGIKAKLHEKVSLKLDARHLLKFDGDKNVMYTLGLVFPLGEKNNKAPEKQIQSQTASTSNQTTKEQKQEPILQEETQTTESNTEQTVANLDSDNDGVLDRNDQCPNSVQGAKVDHTGCEILIEPIDLGVYFDTDSAKVRESDVEKFYPFIEYAKYVKEGKIVIEAHTDDIGPAKYNMGLSHRRAQSVKKQLMLMGVEENRIITKGYGETRPKVPNTSEENRQKNRRVEAKVVK
jgi:OOP family OmpA-OmpF porin